jgi:hypothetical protein
MRIGLVVDSACDLPGDYLRRNGFTILPISVRIGDEVREDQRDEKSRSTSCARTSPSTAPKRRPMPFTVEQITELFLRKLVIDYDYVFCMTITRTRSPIYDNALQASYAILNEYRPPRPAGHDTPFALRVIDTQTLFAAQGITAVEAVRLRRRRRRRAEDPRAPGKPRAAHLRLHDPARPVLPARARAHQGRPQRRPAQRGARHGARHQAGAARLSRRDRAGRQGQGLRERVRSACSPTPPIACAKA